MAEVEGERLATKMLSFLRLLLPAGSRPPTASGGLLFALLHDRGGSTRFSRSRSLYTQAFEVLQWEPSP